MIPFQDLDVDLSFGRSYTRISFCFHLIILSYLSLTAENLTQCGSFLVSPLFLTSLLLCEVAKIYASKRLSGHFRAFSLPHYGNAIRGDPSKGPLLKRTVLRFKKLIFKFKPYQRVGHGILLFLGFWFLIIYITVCFGAPVLSDQLETGSFALLLTAHVFLPALLIFGPEPDLLQRVFFETDLEKTDPISHMLFINALGSILGSWLGAFPIPLDWDRPWQVWPITCVIGAMVGAVLFNIGAMIQLERQLKR